MGGPRKIMEFDGYKGGNKTFGDNRKGYRGGRVPAYPRGTGTWMAAVNLSDQDYATAVYLGCGSVAKGLRIAVQHAAGKLSQTVQVPATRIDAERIVKPAKKRIAQLVSRALGMKVSAPKPAGTQAKMGNDVTPANEWDDIKDGGGGDV